MKRAPYQKLEHRGDVQRMADLYLQQPERLLQGRLKMGFDEPWKNLALPFAGWSDWAMSCLKAEQTFTYLLSTYSPKNLLAVVSWCHITLPLTYSTCFRCLEPSQNTYDYLYVCFLFFCANHLSSHGEKGFVEPHSVMAE